MSGGAAERIRQILNDTRAYRLTGETSADWEVNAAAAALDRLEEAMDTLFGDCFAATASAEQLAQWERIFQPDPSTADLEDRRKVLAARLSVRPTGFTPEDFARTLAAAGIEGTITETAEGLQVTATRLLGIPEAEARRELNLLLPAHIPWTLTLAG